MLVDSHCHLFHCYNFVEEHILKKIEEDFSYLVNIAIDDKEIRRLIKEQFKSKVIKNAIGLYPEQARSFNKEKANEFLRYFDELDVIAIGETGIDFHWDYGDVKIQEALFRFQIELSIEKNLPLLIHSREAFNDTFRILKEYKFYKPFVLHCFGYGVNEAERFLELDSIFSFAGNVTYPKAEELRRVLKLIPLDRILLETDAPYLAPQKVRGEKNSPFNIKYTYEFVSEFLQIEKTKFEKIIEKNFERIFILS
ncbi:MAG: TatD family hydrolase [Brevinematales bacterium]|nr:TatD family hydrolase [Brevinematales bacterium]